MSMVKKPSFFSRITGSADEEYEYPAETGRIQLQGTHDERHAHINTKNEDWAQGAEAGGELAVDVYQTPDAIVIKALVAGVQPTTIARWAFSIVSAGHSMRKWRAIGGLKTSSSRLTRAPRQSCVTRTWQSRSTGALTATRKTIAPQC